MPYRESKERYSFWPGTYPKAVSTLSSTWSLVLKNTENCISLELRILFGRFIELEKKKKGKVAWLREFFPLFPSFLYFSPSLFSYPFLPFSLSWLFRSKTDLVGSQAVPCSIFASSTAAVLRIANFFWIPELPVCLLRRVQLAGRIEIFGNLATGESKFCLLILYSSLYVLVRERELFIFSPSFLYIFSSPFLSQVWTKGKMIFPAIGSAFSSHLPSPEKGWIQTTALSHWLDVN